MRRTLLVMFFLADMASLRANTAQEIGAAEAKLRQAFLQPDPAAFHDLFGGRIQSRPRERARTDQLTVC